MLNTFAYNQIKKLVIKGHKNNVSDCANVVVVVIALAIIDFCDGHTYCKENIC